MVPSELAPSFPVTDVLLHGHKSQACHCMDEVPVLEGAGSHRGEGSPVSMGPCANPGRDSVFVGLFVTLFSFLLGHISNF